MKGKTKSWVEFLFAFLVVANLAVASSPLVTEVELPDFLQGKPVWTVAELPDSRLALGIEGGVAIGAPDSQWLLVPSPGGQPVQTLSYRDGILLAAGSGFCGIISSGTLHEISGMDGEYISSQTVPEGWLVAGRDGLWLVSTNGIAEVILPPSQSGNQTRVAKIGQAVVVSNPGDTPQKWLARKLVRAPEFEIFGKARLYWQAGQVFATSEGLLSEDGSSILNNEATRDLLGAGIVGLAASGPWILVPTFNSGIVAYQGDADREMWRWQPDTNIYCLYPYGEGFLIGTANGLFSMSSPWSTQFAALKNEAIFQIDTSGLGRLEIVTGSGTISLGESDSFPSSNSDVQWPNFRGASVENKSLRFGRHALTLPYRFTKGLAVLNRTSAVALDHGIVTLDSDGTSKTVLVEGGVNSLATDGLKFVAGSNTRGATIISENGRLQRSIGSGRVTVREVRPGKVVLLFWDGAILDSDGNVLGKIDTGNPRDAALIQGKLAILISRPGRDPIVGVLEGNSWRPLDIDGLAFIGAERMSADEKYIFTAGPRGVIRTRLPVRNSPPPFAELIWSAAIEENVVSLPRSTDQFVQLDIVTKDTPNSASTQFRLRIEDRPWSELQPSREFKVPVSWGDTRVTTQTERNGLVLEQAFVVRRPWPWWLKSWAWLLHIGIATGIILAIARLHTHRLERKNRELEQRVALRTMELRKANAAKEEFLAGISHEIRNPLNGVVGICAMLADREVGPREKMLVRTLGGCADQLRSMLDDILDFSRIERGDTSLSNQDFELCGLIEESAVVMDPERQACALMLPDEPVWLHGDSGKLRQIVCNLISNALKYGVPREAGIEVRVENGGNGRSRIRIAVRNSGPTVPAEEIPRLFESFQRGSRTAGMPGSGLGLAVCRRLIQAMGGRITAASVDGVTEFAVEVLLANARPPEMVSDLPAMVSRALAIEDEDYNRIALGHVLRALGYQVDWAADGASALKLASERQYDLVLTDWRLPDMNGGDLCRGILNLLPNPKPPVIAVTAYSTTEKLDEAKAAGMTGFVTKPVTKEKLARVIRGLSEGLQPRRSLDINLAPPPVSPLAALGDLAPSCEQLAGDIAVKWRSTNTLAELRDPRTPREAHALRSLLLLASEEEAAEQIALIESAAESTDWVTVDKLLPFAAEEIAKTRERLSA